MQRLNVSNTLTLIPAQDGDVQVATGTSGWVLLDVQGAQPDVEGNVRHNHGLMRLSYESACELRHALDQITEPVDQRQHALPAIWSEASLTQPPSRPRRRRAVA